MTGRRIQDAAVVLRSHQLGETDRILTLMTYQHGLVRAVAKGARRPSSRFGSRLQPLNLVHVLMYRGRSLATITQAESITLFGGELAGDFVRWSAGHVLAETTERLVPEEDEPAAPQFRLLVAGLQSLLDPERDARLVIDSFLLRSLATGGWAPSFRDCAQCRTPGPHGWIHLPSGGSVCDACRPAAAVSVSANTTELLGALLSGDWQQAEGAATNTRRAASGVVGAYVQLHLDRSLRSLPVADKAWLADLAGTLASEEVDAPT